MAALSKTRDTTISALAYFVVYATAQFSFTSGKKVKQEVCHIHRQEIGRVVQGGDNHYLPPNSRVFSSSRERWFPSGEDGGARACHSRLKAAPWTASGVSPNKNDIEKSQRFTR